MFKRLSLPGARGVQQREHQQLRLLTEDEMADLDDIKEGKDFGIDRPQQNTLYTLKGCGSLDWGMQSRLARIFNPHSNRTVMLAFDHGYFQGPTTAGCYAMRCARTRSRRKRQPLPRRVSGILRNVCRTRSVQTGTRR